MKLLTTLAILLLPLHSLLLPSANAGPDGSNTYNTAPAITSYNDSCIVDFTLCDAAGDDPNPLPHHSGWWTFTPQQSGLCVFDTLDTAMPFFFSNRDTVLGVYRRVNNAFVLVGYSDDYGNSRHARVTAYLTAGTTYYILADTAGATIELGEFAALLRLRHTIPVSAAYRGFVNGGAPLNQRAWFQIQRTPAGMLTGKVIIQGKSQSFVSPIGPDGFAYFIFPGNPDGSIPPVNMQIDCAGSGDKMDVKLTALGQPGSAGTTSLFREITYPKNSPPVHAGRYVFTHADGAPTGFGAFTMSISPTGNISIVGRTGDGTPVSAGTHDCQSVAGQQAFPFYKLLFGKKGLFAGTLFLDTSSLDTGLSGICYLVRPASPASTLFPAGITTQRLLTGGRYTPPAINQRILPSLDPNGTGQLKGFAGDFMAFMTPLTLTTQNQFQFTSTVFKPAFKANPRTGLVTGSLIPPNETKVQKAYGVALRGLGANSFVAGHYSGPTRTTSFTISK